LKTENDVNPNGVEKSRKRKHVVAEEKQVEEVAVESVVRKKKDKKKKKDQEEVKQTKVEDVVGQENVEESKGKKKKKNKKEKLKNGTKILEENGEELQHRDHELQASQKKIKKEKTKRDKTLDAFNSLKKSKGDVEPDKINENEGEEPKKKKVKKVKKLDHVHETKGQGRALRYLDAWQLAQNGDGSSGWKFEKCRQIWLLAHVYDSDRIPDSKFDTMLKYMESIKGMMRKQAIGKVFNMFTCSVLLRTKFFNAFDLFRKLLRILKKSSLS
jgi:hypothetical protein